MDGLLSRGTWGVVTSYRQQTDTDTSFTVVTLGRTVGLQEGVGPVLFLKQFVLFVFVP